MAADLNIQNINARLKNKSPFEIVLWAIEFAKNPIVTTNFRPYEAAILHIVSSIKKDIPVIWCDTGYNTPNTYKHAERLIAQLQLNIDLFVPAQTSSHRDSVLGIPHIDDPKHQIFTEQVKLEPFRRAMEKHRPDLWFTNIRTGQTALRDSLDIVSIGGDGVLKVSPFYYWSDKELDTYLLENNLENEHTYFDPTKALDNRECGLHLAPTK